MIKQKWIDYNKEIADNDYFYIRSCIRQNFFPGSETTFLDILKNKLKLNVFDEPKQTTCTGIGYHSDVVAFDSFQTVIARQFALMSENGYKNLAVSCVTSFGGYNEVLETWKNFPEEEEKARKNLKKATGREFNLPDNVAHTSDVIYKHRFDIAEQQKFKLVNKNTGEPLKIADHIGCHYAKIFPDKGVGGAEYSQVLTGMIKAWGGETVDYPERRHCCGFGFRQYFIKNNRSYSLSNSKKKFESLEEYKPDAILTNCPGCTLFLDRWQYALAQIENKTYGENGNGIPVLTYEELAGLVLGYDPWDLGLQMHQVDVEPFLQKIGIPYSSDLKFADKSGEIIGQPNLSFKLSD